MRTRTVEELINRFNDKHVPLLNFRGKTECFNINILKYINYGPNME